MKITYLHQYFVTPDQPGGTRSYEMARRWVAAGHEVHVVTSDHMQTMPDATSTQTDTVDGIVVHRLNIPYANTMGPAARIRAFLSFALRSARLARSLRGDVVFATSTPLTIVLPALFAIVGRRTPMVFEVRDLWPSVPIALGYLDNPLLRWSARLLERLAYKTARTIVALSPDMASGIIASGVPESKVVVAPNASDVEEFGVPADVGAQYRARNEWLGSRPLIVYCGTLGHVNGIKYLVDIGAELRDLGSDAAIGIYGTGAERDSVEAHARELGVLDSTVYLLDPVPKSQLPVILSAATLCSSFVIPIPILASNSANKFFDSMAAGRAIAINHGGWQAQTIEDHKTGIVLPPADAPAAARLLHDWLQQPEAERAAYGQRARDLGISSFSRDEIASTVLKAIVRAATR